MSRNPGGKLWGLAWRVCEEISSLIGVDPQDLIAAAFIESLFKDYLVEVLRDYFGVEPRAASNIVKDVRRRVEEELS